LIIYPGAERWAPDADVMQRLSCLLTRDVVVEIAPRAQVRAIWQRDHGGRPMPDYGPYAFRAYSRDGRAVIFVDPTETQASTLWLLLHELAHLEVASARMLKSAYRSMPKPPGYMTNDAAHEAHPEEQLANLVATRTLAHLGLPPRQLDRLWWRRRVQAHRRGH
jgi:hypothetical protein